MEREVIVDLRRRIYRVHGAEKNIELVNNSGSARSKVYIQFFEENYTDLLKLYGNWIWIPTLYAFSSMIEDVLSDGTNIKIKLIGVSHFDFFPIWGFLGERNYSFYNNLSSCGFMLREFFEYRGASVSVSINNITDFRVILGICIYKTLELLVPIYLLLLSISLRKLPPAKNFKGVLFSRGPIHAEWFKRNFDMKHWTLINVETWTKFDKQRSSLEMTLRTGFLDLFKVYIRLFKLIFTRDGRKFSLFLPHLQMEMYASTISAFLRRSSYTDAVVAEVLFPFNNFVPKNYKLGLALTTQLPSFECLGLFDRYERVYTESRSLYSGNSIPSHIRIDILGFKEHSLFDPSSSNIIYFSQPVDEAVEDLLLHVLEEWCESNNLILYVKAHPRSTAKRLRSIKGRLLNNWNSGSLNYKLAFIRNSSVVYELLRTKVPVVSVLTGELSGASFESLKGVHTVKEIAGLCEYLYS